MAPRVLVSDKLSETAVQIFRDRGVEVDYLPDLGKDKDALLAAIPNYDGLAIRSATKVTPKILAAANRLKVIGRAGIGMTVDIPAARPWHRGDEHALRQRHHYRRTRPFP
jgi:D-3-phosphoglycerate dehydrogenase